MSTITPAERQRFKDLEDWNKLVAERDEALAAFRRVQAWNDKVRCSLIECHNRLEKLADGGFVPRWFESLYGPKS